MMIDCDTCTVRACGDCVVTTLLRVGGPAPPDRAVHLDDREMAALDLLAGLGMVPPLRHGAFPRSRAS
ncbi:hypothetical protein [Thermomonospora umbrina]|uniref:Uncharacterized protein n=1 Tax=Thermomonospora umbrina TaxID=111806 RepID=A0A3D9T487_9ACTN|nr:hypothetical protein [Thermomonospora umbrina]REE99514.1 hypothetical protein DFJ69_5027 [Thermomonospora umbrina]